ncbi:MAG: hypothetical protein ABIH77_00750 [Pseudomonadota bacterium]|nr:hypothetical protein [Gammaproteobacteria bacterium]MBU2546176.1 hypothetical protein [Gammaproteobacteria bacterium]
MQGRQLTKEDLVDLLGQKIQKTDFNKAKEDVLPFIKDKAELDVWSKDFFMAVLDRLKAQQ